MAGERDCARKETGKGPWRCGRKSRKSCVTGAKGRRSWLTACNSAERSSKVKTWKSTGFSNMEITSDHSKKGVRRAEGTVEPVGKDGKWWNQAGWYNFKSLALGFPGGRVVKNSPANAGDTGLLSGPGRCHMPGSNWACMHNYWASALEPKCHNFWSPLFKNSCSTTREVTAIGSPHTARKSSPYLSQLGKAHVQQQRPSTAK